ncbi:MmgE/PrpD family protein [Paraburkholderia hospita]|jgi:2-methylcitrate dehydratase PrpD|uniref:MmgE/PrpD family protein n=1 Tax=Paraburkholderia hospita TaxID=169430 RepID=UPI000DEF6AB9|nr:MmgE/PrpD family protein [Paraburkholderia hospita]AXF01766.1 MmgE/PrpD family protein [Paraburkholderia hospita]
MNSRHSIQLQAQTISQRLAAFTTHLKLDEVPQDVRERAKHLMLDSIGLSYATLKLPYATSTLAAMQELGTGEATVFGHRERLALRDAMLLNGLLIHSLDFDDTHARGVIHSTASALPCAFNLAEREDASGADLLLAYLCAMEVSTRIGAAAKSGFHHAGFHPTGLAAVFGCSLAAARLLDLNEEAARHAQGIALSMASGNLEFLQDGAWTKRLHPGWAAVAGTTAATLAKHGYIGPGAPYEGRFGLYALYLKTSPDAPDLALATHGLGETWEIDDVSLKPIPACHFTHASSDAAVALYREHRVSADEIERVVVRVPEATIPIVCEPVANKQKPANSYDAQFSIPYIVATGLLRGRFTLDDLDPAALTDKEVRALAARVTHEADPDTTFPRHYTGEVIVYTRDGQRLAHREAINRGSADRPLSNDDIVAKFYDNAQRGVSREEAERICEAVLSLDRQPARALANVLRASQ